MPLLAIIFGALLDAVGIAGFALTNFESWTALIPSILGSLLIIFGIVSLVKPGLRKHMMHGAAAVGLLGLLGSARGLIALPALLAGEDVARPAAVIAQSATAVLCAIFVILCVGSFLKARAARNEASGIEIK